MPEIPTMNKILILLIPVFFWGCAPEDETYVETYDDCSGQHSSFAFNDKLPKFSERVNLFIIGGGRKSDDMMQYLLDSCLRPEASSIVILPWSSSEPDTAAWYARQQFEALSSLTITSFSQTPDSLSPNEVMQIRNADLIYLSGGDQSRFLEAISNRPDVKEAIAWASVNGGCVAGTSAGAALMSKVMITGDQKSQEEYERTYATINADNAIYAKGLGLIDGLIVDQHFLARSRHNRLLTALHDHPNNIGVGIDESTALWVNGAVCTVVGESQVLLFYPPEKSKIENGKIGLQGIRLDVLLPGEKILLP
jgi:cyanophycinase